MGVPETLRTGKLRPRERYGYSYGVRHWTQKKAKKLWILVHNYLTSTLFPFFFYFYFGVSSTRAYSTTDS